MAGKNVRLEESELDSLSAMALTDLSSTTDVTQVGRMESTDA